MLNLNRYFLCPTDTIWSKMTSTLTHTWLLLLRYVPSPFVREEENMHLRCAIAVFVFDLLLVFLSLSLTLSLSLSCRRQRVTRMQDTRQNDWFSISLFRNMGRCFLCPMGINWSKMTCTLMDTWCLPLRYVPPNSLFLFVCVCEREKKRMYIYDLQLLSLSLTCYSSFSLSLLLSLFLSLSCRRQRVRRMQDTQQKDWCSFSFLEIRAGVFYAQWISTGQKWLVP